MFDVFAAYRLILLIGLLSLAAMTPAADWPQFQGPNRDGHSPEKGLARSWPEGGPKVLWSLPVEAGYGGAVVREGKVYFIDRSGPKETAQDVLRSVDLKTGKALGEYRYEAPGELPYKGSRSLPAVDERHVYYSGGFGHLTCLDRVTLKPVWQINLLTEFGGQLPEWGVSQSPLLHEDQVIVAPYGMGAGVVGLDRKTGKTVWQSPPIQGKADYTYVSPMLVNLAGVDQIVVATAPNPQSVLGVSEPGLVVGLSPQDGHILWTYEGWQCKIPIASPIAVGPNRLFVTGGYRAGSVFLDFEKRGDQVALVDAQETSDFGSPMHQPVLYKDHLYGVCNGHTRRDGLSCMTLNAELKWKTANNPYFERGSILVADDLFFVMDGYRGELYLIEPNPTGYKELAKAKVFETKFVWAPMALSEGILIARDQETMKAFDVKAPK